MGSTQNLQKFQMGHHLLAVIVKISNGNAVINHGTLVLLSLSLLQLRNQKGV